MTTSMQEVLAKIASKEITPEEGAKLLDELMPKQVPGKLTFKVTEAHKEEKDGKGNVTRKASNGGAVSIYGLQAKFPVTLYIEQLERLWAAEPELKAFCKANESKLSRKH